MVNGLSVVPKALGGTQPTAPLEEKTPEQKCKEKGGFWDSARETCLMSSTRNEPADKRKLTTPEVFTDPKTGRVSGITLPDGRTFLGLGPDDVKRIAAQEAARGQPPEGTVPVGTAEDLAKRQAEAQRLSGQVGEIGPSDVTDPTGLSETEALTAGVRDSIPGAIRLAAQAGVGAAAIGAVATAPAGGIGAVPAAAIGAAAGFTAGIVGGMIGNFKGQRTDTTTAQQRVLDEGKQTLMDWVTLAKADPARKEFYLSQFNQQLQLIQDAHVQMLVDTNADVLKFETALPNLAEFNSFYDPAGERDALVDEMRLALQTPSGVNYEMLLLAQRYKG